MSGAIVKVSPLVGSAMWRAHSSLPSSASSASRYPSDVARTTRPSFTATPRLLVKISAARGVHTLRHFGRHVDASSAIEA
jgi:hypothetical protein